MEGEADLYVERAVLLGGIMTFGVNQANEKQLVMKCVSVLSADP